MTNGNKPSQNCPSGCILYPNACELCVNFSKKTETGDRKNEEAYGRAVNGTEVNDAENDGFRDGDNVVSDQEDVKFRRQDPTAQEKMRSQGKSRTGTERRGMPQAGRRRKENR